MDSDNLTPNQRRLVELRAKRAAENQPIEAELAAIQAEEAMTLDELCEKWEKEADEQTDNPLDWQIYMDMHLTAYLRKKEPGTLHAIYRKSIPAPPELLEWMRKTARGEECEPPTLSHPPMKGLQRHPAYIMRPRREE